LYVVVVVVVVVVIIIIIICPAFRSRHLTIYFAFSAFASDHLPTSVL